MNLALATICCALACDAALYLNVYIFQQFFFSSAENENRNEWQNGEQHQCAHTKLHKVIEVQSLFFFSLNARSRFYDDKKKMENEKPGKPNAMSKNLINLIKLSSCKKNDTEKRENRKKKKMQ